MKALTELKKECFKHIGSNTSCFCCGESKLTRLLAHHLSYTSKSVTYNKWGNSDHERLKYYSNLLDEIKDYPDNFLVMCFNCHKKLEDLLKLSYEDAFEWVKSNDPNVRLILAYNLTQKKRNKKTLENPEDIFIPPEFLKNFSDFQICHIVNGKLYEYSHEEVSEDVLNIYEKIIHRSFSLNEFASTRILSQDLDKYIRPYPFHIQAAKLLESIREVKKGDKISYIVTKSMSFPIELVRKDQIDIGYYSNWFKSEFLRIFNTVYTEYDFKKMTNQTGLDEFFWS